MVPYPLLKNQIPIFGDEHFFKFKAQLNEFNLIFV